MRQAQRQLPGEEEETEQIRNQQWQQSWTESEWEQPVPKKWAGYQEETSQQAETQKVEVQKGGETQRNPTRMQQIAWLFEQTMENQHQIIRDRQRKRTDRKLQRKEKDGGEGWESTSEERQIEQKEKNMSRKIKNKPLYACRNAKDIRKNDEEKKNEEDASERSKGNREEIQKEHKGKEQEQMERIMNLMEQRWEQKLQKQQEIQAAVQEEPEKTQ